MSLRARIAVPEETGAGREDGHLVASYRAKLLEEIDLAEMSALAAAERRARLERVLGHIISREGPVLSTAERAQLIRRVVDEALGLGILEPLLEDASITEIMVNGPDQIFVERGGRVEQLPLRFASHEQLMQTIERIVSTVNRRVDESNPMVDARLPSGERVNVIIPPLSLTGRDAHHPPLPAVVHAPGDDRLRLARRAHAAAARRARAGQVQRHRVRAPPAPARRPSSTPSPA